MDFSICHSEVNYCQSQYSVNKLELSIHTNLTYMIDNRKIFVNSDLIHCASFQKYNTVQKFGVSIIFLCF